MTKTSLEEERAHALERAEENIELAWLALADNFDLGTALMVLHAIAAQVAETAFVRRFDPKTLH